MVKEASVFCRNLENKQDLLHRNDNNPSGG